MGAAAIFHCLKCGYDTAPDLYDAIGYYCDHCKEVYGFLNTPKWIEQVAKEEAICNVCNIGVLKEWDYICPKCGEVMHIDPCATLLYF